MKSRCDAGIAEPTESADKCEVRRLWYPFLYPLVPATVGIDGGEVRLIVALPMVISGSYADIRNGLRTPGNCVYVKAYREFESHPIRCHLMTLPSRQRWAGPVAARGHPRPVTV